MRAVGSEELTLTWRIHGTPPFAWTKSSGRLSGQHGALWRLGQVWKPRCLSSATNMGVMHADSLSHANSAEPLAQCEYYRLRNGKSLLRDLTRLIITY